MKKKKTNNSAVVAFVNFLAIDSLTHDIIQIEAFYMINLWNKEVLFYLVHPFLTYILKTIGDFEAAMK